MFRIVRTEKLHKLKIYLGIFLTFFLSLSPIVHAKPISYDIYDEALNDSLGNRPFFVTPSASCSSTSAEVSACRGAIQGALRAKKYRVIGSKKNVSDFNIINCTVDLTKERKA